MKKIVNILMIILLFVIFFVPSICALIIKDQDMLDIAFKYWYLDILGLVILIIYIFRR